MTGSSTFSGTLENFSGLSSGVGLATVSFGAALRRVTLRPFLQKSFATVGGRTLWGVSASLSLGK